MNISPITTPQTRHTHCTNTHSNMLPHSRDPTHHTTCTTQEQAHRTPPCITHAGAMTLLQLHGASAERLLRSLDPTLPQAPLQLVEHLNSPHTATHGLFTQLWGFSPFPQLSVEDWVHLRHRLEANDTLLQLCPTIHTQVHLLKGASQKERVGGYFLVVSTISLHNQVDREWRASCYSHPSPQG